MMSNKFLNIKKLQKRKWNTQRNKNVSILHKMIPTFFLIPRPHRHQMTCQKHRWITDLIQENAKPTKPVSFSNESSTFQDKRKSNSEETPLKQPQHYAFTSNQVILERIKCLYQKCAFLNTEHLFMLPIYWFNHFEVPDDNVEILVTFIAPTLRQKIYILRKISRVEIPKSMVVIIIF